MALKSYCSILPKHPHKFMFLPEGLACSRREMHYKFPSCLKLVCCMEADHSSHLDVLWNSFSNSSSFSKCTYKNKTKCPLNSLFRGPTLLQQSQLTREKFQQNRTHLLEQSGYWPPQGVRSCTCGRPWIKPRADPPLQKETPPYPAFAKRMNWRNKEIWEKHPVFKNWKPVKCYSPLP